MQFFFILKNSLLLPRKDALFQLNRVSMRNTIAYVFIVMFILQVPDMISAIVKMDKHIGMPKEIYILNLIVSYPLLFIFATIIGISLLAALSLLLVFMLNRKLAYPYIWKVTTYSLTIPIIMYHVLLEPLALDYSLAEIIFILFFLLLMYRIITIYPKYNGKIR
ncbi:hypothetical protein [Radiobacillus deserti]|uniref:DUF1189 domain-containing protein n=1 Tax=Radiobacillus deserti TaxID=2594883 RepID=A0A516KG32_9BACI|nr:hypothetical protein [Radiobacillus deserti]QDP40354.1 hypothetical protein FN924_09295 [Radiobacillus deserti]